MSFKLQWHEEKKARKRARMKERKKERKNKKPIGNCSIRRETKNRVNFF